MERIEKKSEVEQWLDTALRQYGEAEPRAGLKNRVLASLQVERSRMRVSRPWWSAFGLATALAAITVAVWIWRGSRDVRPANTAGITTTLHEATRGSIERGPVPGITHPAVSYPARQVATRKPTSRLTRNQVVAVAPKMEQFPSPQPLSEQERLLMSYVARDPENAVTVAQARAEALAQDRAEEAAWAAKGSTE